MSQYRPTSKITLLVLHCSATPNGQFIRAEDIDQWHAARGFARDPKLAEYSNLKHIGYHYFINAHGAMMKGRRDDETGAHAKGYNLLSIGTCIVGTDKYSIAQWKTLAKHVELQLKKYPKIKDIIGHRDLSADLNGDGIIEPSEWMKTCPGFDVKAWLDGGMKPLDGHILEEDNNV